ncbi:MAG: RIO1 family regulatory kinase/ATPase domain-containing protein [Planctomycetota bacterium]|jgi:RIO kinase 1
MHADSDISDAFEGFFDEGWISEVLYEVKGGKEAVIYCCRGGALLPGRLVAAKAYRSKTTRSFKNDAIYQAGRMQFAHDTRLRRALRAGSDFGHKAAGALWLEHEWETMSVLHGAGADVPRPIRRNHRAILMPYIGDEDGPAPMLRELRLDPAETAAVVDDLLDNVELMLDRHRVHGDLSPYNVLYWRGRATIIDFPQAVDPRLNPAARALLARDVDNICVWARRHGVDRPAARIAVDLWSRFVIGELG